MESFEKFDNGRIEIQFDENFYDKEKDTFGIWRWVKSSDAELSLKYNGDGKRDYEVEFELLTPISNRKFTSDIYLDNVLWGHIVGPCKVVIPLTLISDQKKVIRVRCNTSQICFPNDNRELYFQFRNYSVHMEPHYINDTIQSVRKVQIELLKKLIEVCEVYKLNYYAIYGTLLGIIRNQNYLPWDDDIDICMPRKDFNKLLSLDKDGDVFGSKYFLQTMYSDENVFFGGYAKLRDNDTTGITEYTYQKECNNGIWIDIFPLDECKDMINQHKKISLIQGVLCYKTDKNDGRYRSCLKWNRGIALLAGAVNRKFWCKKLDKYLEKYYNKEKTYYAILARILPVDKVNRFKKEWFEEYEIKKFGDLDLRIPFMYDECLKELFGYNYMVYPDVSMRRPHKGVYYNTEIAYADGSKLYEDQVRGMDL